MPAPDWEDLSEFLDVDDFADIATVTPVAGDSFEVAGIFDDPYLNAQLGEYQTDISDPRFTCAEAAVANVQRGDRIEVAGKVWDVLTSPQSDGTGVAILKLAAPPPTS